MNIPTIFITLLCLAGCAIVENPKVVVRSSPSSFKIPLSKIAFSEINIHGTPSDIVYEINAALKRVGFPLGITIGLPGEGNKVYQKTHIRMKDAELQQVVDQMCVQLGISYWDNARLRELYLCDSKTAAFHPEIVDKDGKYTPAGPPQFMPTGFASLPFRRLILTGRSKISPGNAPSFASRQACTCLFMPMADFSFYIDRTDRDSILNALLDGTGLRVTPNINHPAPLPESYENLTPELVRCLDVNPRCYLSGAFPTRNVETVRMEKGAYVGTYVVTENKGGPVLVLSLVTQIIEDGTECLVPSHLTYAAKFWHEESVRLVPPSEGLKAAFKRVRDILMGECIKVKKPCPVWIGRSAVKKLEAGETSILANGVRIRQAQVIHAAEHP